MDSLVTVYIPTHNRATMLERAVNSVLRQTYCNIEIIISDDGSSDNTSEIVAKLSEKHKNIVYLRSELPKGACHARNLAINKASGEFITGLDDDDEFEIERIREFVEISKVKSNYSFISSGVKKIQKEGIAYNYITAREITTDMLKNSNCVGNQIFIKTELLRGIDGFDEKLTAWQDYDCWLRLILKYGKAYNCASYTYIMHTEHESGRITTGGKVTNAVDYFILKHKNVLNEENIKNIRFNQALYYSNQNKFPLLLKYPTFHNTKLYARNVISRLIFKLKIF